MIGCNYNGYLKRNGYPKRNGYGAGGVRAKRDPFLKKDILDILEHAFSK
jgi:hypothetical protein